MNGEAGTTEAPMVSPLLAIPALRVLREVAAGRSDVAVTLHDREGGVLWASPEGVEAILGAAVPSGSLRASVLGIIHEDDVVKVLVALRRVAKGETADFGIRVRHLDGHWVGLRTIAWPIEDVRAGSPVVVAVSVPAEPAPGG